MCGRRDSGYGNWPGLVCDRRGFSTYAYLLAAPGATSSPARGRRRPAMLVGLHVCVQGPRFLTYSLRVYLFFPGSKV